MSDLTALYHDLIFDHSQNPKCFRTPKNIVQKHESFNPLCGDKVCLFYDGQNYTFEGKGCAMSMASASLLLEHIANHAHTNPLTFLADLFQMLDGTLADDKKRSLGKLQVLETVKHYPSRVKCVTLSWHALRELILKGGADVSSEHSSCDCPHP
ncbi:MAG: SUF system NifU family Fe-S cluster assembly protein [Gammaproteobacteria bacterium]|nr:SUF system NifU family Fe-S cluster assembly protein [Gammaproteobacteria bacterium]